MLLRGRQFYYRHTIPIEVRRLTVRAEIWRSLRTGSLKSALRWLPIVASWIEAETESARSEAGLTVDHTFSNRRLTICKLDDTFDGLSSMRANANRLPKSRTSLDLQSAGNSHAHFARASLSHRATLGLSSIDYPTGCLATMV
jgi:hypothetical protein